MKPLSLLVVTSLLLAASHQARAAESYDNCTGYITTVPTTITSQGTWCMKADVATAVSSGAAITVAAHNVTLDCNNFKLGGLGAGAGTLTKGVYAKDRVGLTVRHCNIRGFHFGVLMEGGASHVVENNIFLASTFAGVSATTIDGAIIRDNVFTDTGGSTITSWPNPIQVVGGSSAIISNNLISGVTPGGSSGNVDGIQLYSTARGAVVTGNRIFGLHAGDYGAATGITLSPYAKAVDNMIDNVNGGGGSVARGFYCLSGTASDQPIVRNNMVTQTTTLWNGSCYDGGSNLLRP